MIKILNLNKKGFILFVILVWGIHLFSNPRNEIDSLNNLLSSSSNDTIRVALYLDIAEVYESISIDTAVIFADKALQLAEDNENLELVADANSRFGGIFFSQGIHNRAISYYFKVLEYYELKGNIRDLIVINFNIGLVYNSLNDNARSQEYYLKALEFLENNMETDTSLLYNIPVGRVYNNIGVTYNDDENYDVALDYFYKALKVSDETNSEIAKPYVYNNIGLVYHAKQDYEIALSFYFKSLEIRKKIDDPKGLALTYSYMADSYRLKQEKELAFANFDTAFDLAKEHKYYELQLSIAETMVEYYAEAGDLEKSYEMHMVFKELTEQLDIIEGSKAAAMLDMQYKFDKFQKEIELDQQRSKFRNFMLIAILIALLIMFTLFFFLAQSKVRRIRLHREKLLLEKENLEGKLDYRNKELTTNVMYLVRKNELISNISERLLNLKEDLTKTNQKPIHEIILELQRSVDDDVWKEFEYRFKEVHEDFYTALNDRYPDLSPNEKKLCAFLRLNMSTKDISAITFQTTHSITIARSRLRKKLDINNTDVNLVDFLAGL